MNERQKEKIVNCLSDAAKALLQIAGAYEAKVKMEAAAATLPPVCFTWEDAVHVMRETCVAAPVCGPGCEMYEWCQDVLGKSPAPAEWPSPTGAGE